MKWFFITLLAINLLYLGWELDRQVTISRARDGEALLVPAHTRQLALVKELPAPPPARKTPPGDKEPAEATGTDAGGTTSHAAESPPTDVKIEEKFAQELVAALPDISVIEPVAAPESSESLCFSFGPFPDERQGAGLKSWFEERHVLVQQRPEKDREKQLFWIYLAPQESLNSAMQAIKDLEKKGIADYRLIETGDLRNAISLGLFSTQASVNKRLNELKDKGYQPIVVPYREASLVYWVDVKLVNQHDILSRMFTDEPARYNSITMPCSEIALPGDTP